MSLLPVSNDSSVELSSQLAQRLGAGAKIALIGLQSQALQSETAEALLRRAGAQGGYQLTFVETGQSFMLTASQARLFVPGSADAARLFLRLESGPGGETLASLESASLEGAAGAAKTASAAPAARSDAPAASNGAALGLRLSGAGQALAAAERSIAHLPADAPLSSMASLSQSGPHAQPRASVEDLARSLSRMLPSEGIGYERALARLTLSEAPANQTLAQALERFAQISSPESLGAPSPGEPGSPPMAALAHSARAQESSFAAWSGALWPGASAQALLGSSTRAEQAFNERERDPWLPASSASEPAAWLRLKLDLPGLGGLELWAAHIAGRTFARLKTPSAESSEALRSLFPSFEKALEQSQVSLSIAEGP